MGAGRRSAMPRSSNGASWPRAEAERIPDRARDGTATWSLSLLQKALRQAPDGLPRVSTYQHLYDLAHPARGRPELAEEPHLVRDRGSRAPAQAWHGHGRRP